MPRPAQQPPSYRDSAAYRRSQRRDPQTGRQVFPIRRIDEPLHLTAQRARPLLAGAAACAVAALVLAVLDRRR